MSRWIKCEIISCVVTLPQAGFGRSPVELITTSNVGMGGMFVCVAYITRNTEPFMSFSNFYFREFFSFFVGKSFVSRATFKVAGKQVIFSASLVKMKPYRSDNRTLIIQSSVARLTLPTTFQSALHQPFLANFTFQPPLFLLPPHSAARWGLNEESQQI